MDHQGKLSTGSNAPLTTADSDQGKRVELSPFERYWAAVPVKIARKLCADIWKRKRLDDKLPIILADIELRKRTDDRWLKGFIPNPATYLRQERWEDEIVKPHRGVMKPLHIVTPSLPRSPIDHDKIHVGILAAKAVMRRG